ncbi:MAG: sugar ABC transporter permease [Paenibacillaceae bacterium]|uniref:Sugar ABC transporter permease n=1 Tax=Paenibacillus mellifer TaxID=2937794 RepID=A0A9X1XVW8_9BACL|nr:sugar ABC transporter permease [Paenibacillus mellifer]MBW4841295.1 sugar ABC transporter permease [Paenibacillaceae bacterium]MCK8486555.1 sugar ABC transporter permease [Paenibacillus mellifer]
MISQWLRSIKSYVPGTLFILPAFVLFAVFIFIPLGYGLGMSFTDYGGFNLKANFVGTDNYAKLFQDDYFLISLKNNLIYTLVFVPLTVLLALSSAVALNGIRHLRKYLRMAFYFPQITSMVSIAIVWGLLFNPMSGPINTVLKGIGIANPPEWLMSSHWALLAIILVAVWKSFGYYMIILLAGIQGIPEHLYESAKLDGANKFQQFLYITLPSLSPTLFMVLVLTIINSFQVFDLVSVMTDGGPGRSTNVLVFRIYQEAFIHYRMGYAAAMSAVLFLIIMVISLIQFRMEKKWVTY